MHAVIQCSVCTHAIDKSGAHKVRERSGLRTEIGRIVVVGAGQIQVGQERHQMLRGTLVDAVAAGHREQLVKHLEQQGAGLVYGADNGAAFLRESFQQRDAAGRG